MSTTLKDLATIRAGAFFAKGSAEGDAKVSIIRNKNIREGGIASVASLEVVHLSERNASRSAVSTGDILVALKGVNPLVALVPASHAGCVVANVFAILTPTDAAAGKRLSDYLASEAGQDALRGIQRGVAIPAITIVDLAALVVP